MDATVTASHSIKRLNRRLARNFVYGRQRQFSLFSEPQFVPDLPCLLVLSAMPKKRRPIIFGNLPVWIG